VKQAQRSWERIERLRKESAVAQQQADDAQSELESATAAFEASQARFALLDSPPRADEVRLAKARIRAAEAELQLAEINVDRCTLRAPSNAQILDLNTEVGELTGPEATKAPVTLADTSSLRVRAFIEEFDAPKVQPGMKAKVTADGLPDQTFEGVVASLSPQMTLKQLTTDHAGERLDIKTREVWIDLGPSVVHCEYSPSLVVGLRVDVEIATLSAEKREP
jgi:multidrug resistance efflux pump